MGGEVLATKIEWSWQEGRAHDDHGVELVQMARDAWRVLEALRSAAHAEEQLQVREGLLLPMRPKEFIGTMVAPHFGSMVERLREVQKEGTRYHLSAAGCQLLAVAHDTQLPPWFADEEMQLTYRRTWFATGHLTVASGDAIRGLPSAERIRLASAAACVLLDPTVDHITAGETCHPKGALRILERALRQRVREGVSRDR